MLTDFFRHTCTITHRTETGEQDKYGKPEVATTVTSGVKCRFFDPKGDTKILPSGVHVIARPKVLLHLTTTVAAGDTIHGNVPGFDCKYRAGKPRVVYTADGPSHIRVELEAV